MKCPHCLQNFHESWQKHDIGDAEGSWGFQYTTCPACRRFISYLRLYKSFDARNGAPVPTANDLVIMVLPKTAMRAPLPQEVPAKFAEDYKEACLVLADSPKASAALSRRCLQNLLRDHANVKHSDLNNEIQQVLDSGKLPSHLADAIDAVRVGGNFAAHPIKSKNTGEVIDVEPGEAEWLLDTLEGLFDFYFVQPAVLKRKRDALNQKLKDAGKPPLK